VNRTIPLHEEEVAPEGTRRQRQPGPAQYVRKLSTGRCRLKSVLQDGRSVGGGRLVGRLGRGCTKSPGFQV